MCDSNVPHDHSPMQPPAPCPGTTTTLADLETLQQCLTQIRDRFQACRDQLTDTTARLTEVEEQRQQLEEELLDVFEAGLGFVGLYDAATCGWRDALAERDEARDAATLAGLALQIAEDEARELRKRLGEQP